jgi:LysM repeat protein
MIKYFLIIFISAYSFAANAQRVTVEEYIEQFKDIAINEMKRSGVPASITLAQGILESENGNSELVKKSNNHFGIKCKNNWTGESVTHDDDANGECFRAYTNAGDSYRDHSNFLKSSQRYASLFNLVPTDYEGWARGLKKAGYATNPKYPDILIKYIEQYNLQQYSLLALNKIPSSEVMGVFETNVVYAADKIEGNQSGAVDNHGLKTDLDKIISINKTSCVVAPKGTSLLVIANKHHINLGKLMEFNDMSEEGLLKRDQPVYLQKKSKTGGVAFYLVQPGETIFDIAQKNAIQLKYLLEYNNNIKADTKLTPGTKLVLQPGLKSTVTLPDDKITKVHMVAPKEGLYAIAKTYNVTVAQLREWNRLDSDNLTIGQAIIVSK